MADFTGLDLPGVVETSSTDLMEEFYIPLLTQATEYKRGVGYFSSGWIRSAARGLTALAERGGTAKWIMSPILDEADLEAIEKGSEAKRNETVRESLEQTISDLEAALDDETRNAVAWLIADGILEVRFAVPTNALEGQFHDKWGVFYDESKNRVAFHGSLNDSLQAQSNYESYDVFCDWRHSADSDRVDQHEARFDDLWNGDVESVAIHTVGETIRRGLIELRSSEDRPYTSPPSVAKPDHSITLRDYQREAVDAWFANDKRGLFEMATGTGKTYTAIGAMDEVLQTTDGPLLVVISVPMRHLAPQWKDSLADFGYTTPHYLFGSRNANWKEDLERIVSDLNLGFRDTEIIITTHISGAKERFRELVKSLDIPILFIGDEVHNLGSEHKQKGLLPAYDYRIGLSATPERYYDEEGSQFLLRYFGGTIYQYSLGDAIPEHLSGYNYYPEIVEMEPAELSEYQSYTTKIVSTKNSENTDDEALSRLLQDRARIIKSAEAKFKKLRKIVQTVDIDHMLIYTNHEQIDRVQELLTEEGVVQHRFTSEESDEERANILDAFARGEFDALVAMKCLDEGVDVPSTKQAVMMSNSKNPMQFVQRRGRVLRREAGTGPAEIYDMIVVPTLDPGSELLESERNIVRKELDRFDEFVENARNTYEARNAIQRVRTAYQV